MKYPFMKIENDGTEITYNPPDIYNHIQVYLERWNQKDNTFNDLTIEIPDGKLISNHGYTEDEVCYYMDKVKGLTQVIFWDYADNEASERKIERN